MHAIAIRRLHPNDPCAGLDARLRRAIAAFERLSGRGDCFVAVADARIVGIIVLRTTNRDSNIRWYRDPAVASVHQLAVEPSQQGQGIGQALLRTAQAWARCRKYMHLAVDTPASAWDLQSYYRRRGFVLADIVQGDVGPCLGVVLTKALQGSPAAPEWAAWPARHPAEKAPLPGEAAANTVRAARALRLQRS